MRRVFACRVDLRTPEVIDALAKDLGCLRIDGKGVLKGSTGVLLDQIAQGRLKIVPGD